MGILDSVVYVKKENEPEDKEFLFEHGKFTMALDLIWHGFGLPHVMCRKYDSRILNEAKTLLN